MKRLIDIVLSSIALLVLSPLLFPIAVILKLTGEHYIFYKQERVGFKGKSFGLLKFATMLKDSPNLGTGDITLQNDPRVLPFGRFLRKIKINELPQIINVIKGDMSIIGPRPLTQKNFDYYPDKIREVIGNIRPGLSGVGSIIFRDEETKMANSDMPCYEFYKQHIAPYKGELEIWYQHNRCLWVDMMLVFLTVWVIVFPKSNLIFRLFHYIPQRPLFLVDARDRKVSMSSVQAIENASRIVEIGSTASKDMSKQSVR